jgi:DNA transformation protein
MSVSDADIAFVTGLFADLGTITSRKMMGGLCLYAHDVLFAIIHGDGRVYLKATGEFAAVLGAQGAVQWTYTRKDGKLTAMPYWTLPDAALDDPDLACDLARQALTHLE